MAARVEEVEGEEVEEAGERIAREEEAKERRIL